MEEQDYIIYDGELYHYGRKGMKWGQHIFAKVKTGASKVADGTKKVANKTKTGIDKAKTKHAAKKAEEEAKKARAEAEETARKRAKITNSRKLTTDELNERIKRLELEQRYQDLVESTSDISKGRTFVESVIETSGKNLLTQVLNHYGAKGLNKLIGEDVIFANNKKK